MATTLSGAPDTWPYSAREAAALLGLSERTVRRAIARGMLAATKHAGVYRIAPDAVESFRTRRLHSRHADLGADHVSGSFLESHPPPPQLHLIERIRGPAFDLPSPVASFLGRGRETSAAIHLVSQADTRLLTLTGPGGVGKTRLALRLAGFLASPTHDEVAFVSLAPVVDADLVPHTLAHALGVREHGEHTPLSQLVMALRHRKLLLILDNFEHVLAAAPDVAALLASCPGLTVLVTSRTALNISGEHVFAVPPLALPNPEAFPTAASASRAEAVQLFVDRAHAATASFTLTDENAAEVAAICRRLDGLPLAIELAAARIPLLPPRALLARLDRQMAMLTDGPRDAPARLRSMRDAIAWSHDLLSPAVRLLFRRLAVFAGGCTLEALTAVAGGRGDPLSDIGSLVAGSLLRQEEGADGAPRFLMLEPIRQFAREQLEAAGEAVATQQRHAAYYLTLVERWSPDPPTPGDDRVLAALSPEYDNIRLALSWFDTERDAEGLPRLAGALFELWYARGLLTEGRWWTRRALLLAAGTADVISLRALSTAGAMAILQHDVAAARPLISTELPVARALGDRYRLLPALINTGLLAQHEQRHDEAEALMEEAFRVAAELGPDDVAAVRLAGVTSANLGYMALNRGGRLDRANDWFTTSISLLRPADYAWGLTDALAGLGSVRAAQGKIVEATGLTTEALALARDTGDPGAMATALRGVVGIACAAHNYALSAHLIGAIEGIHQRLGISAPVEEPAENRGIQPRWRAVALAALGERRFAEEMAKGRAMTIESAVAAAQDVLTTIGASQNWETPPALSRLTAREHDVLRRVMLGWTDREIGDDLFLSRRTVNAHVSHILAKLDVRTRRQAAARGRELGLLLGSDDSMR